ncbi:lipid-A-disaccharide synthase [Macromonas nakdongensis]|uniref:lipid-A-disaccharide synthase n=1 Tax=Macromonas nakdongensis TaxID=1843082 RepID=UPI001E52FF8D|nr:lipid-A-disaccharide synthase [Macromonas nakdongensis]
MAEARGVSALAMVAGETSGDLLAAQLLDGIQRRWPACRAFGIGGPAMQSRGFEAWWPSEKLAVRGYVEVLRHYREIVGIRRALKARLLTDRPQVFIGVDAPDFNLDLEGDLRAAGCKTVHFVAPAVWAWRPERVEKIRRCVDHVLCIFPFEPELLARHGIAATYVGHPLAPLIPKEPDRAAARAHLGLPQDAPVVALLPGSRRAEIEHLLPRFLQAARLMRQANPTLRLVVPVVPALWDAVQALLRQSGLAGEVLAVRGDSHRVLAACDVTLIASGTATLEAALFKRPMVIAYHMNWLSWQLTRRKMLQPWVGLPNILAGEFVVPELLQDAATPEALARETLAWLAPDAATRSRVQALQQRFAALHDALWRDTPTLALDAIETVLAA